jgi:hypothetical protein
MRKTLLAGAGALAVAVSAFAGNAEAQCWWTGFGYSCVAEPSAAYSPYPYSYPVGAAPYAAWNAWDYRDYRYQPSWLPSYPGPKPSSGTFGGW